MEFIEWIRVNPAGNITCLVVTKVPREKYMDLARKILASPDQDFEQVGFIVNETTMEMAGLEFCGNASRAFGLWSAKKQGIKGKANIAVRVSGIENLFEVFVDTDTDYTQATMPLPEKIEIIHEGIIPACPRLLKVYLGGIMHFVVLDMDYSESIFKAIKNYGIENFNPPALGVMFVDSKNYSMVPIVYVKEVDTTYHEGSCGSGTVAAIIALAEKCPVEEDGLHCELVQPKGMISASLYKKNDIITKITIEGPVEIGTVEGSNFNDLSI
jgi:diaminopimelate epimerase